MEKREAARILFMEGVEQKQIAQIINVSENTVSKWANLEGWKDTRMRIEIRDQTSEERVRELIEYQLECLKRIKDKHMEDQSFSLLKAGDIDSLQKLFTTIKRPELKFGDIVKIIREFTDFVSKSDLDLAKQLVDISNTYINEKRKVIS